MADSRPRHAGPADPNINSRGQHPAKPEGKMTTVATNTDHDIAYLQQAAPVAVQILSMIFFVAFAIISTALAFNWFWPAGFALAVIFAMRGFGPFHSGAGPLRPRPRKDLADVATEATAMPVLKPSGNSSFDAYRTDMLARLETEHHSFQEFLARLRDARDKTEFDRFMDDRANKARPVLSDADMALSA
jgi:Protein of unknown function (DUF2852)